MRFLGLGGTDEVGASCYLYEFSGARVLIDAGLRPTMLGEASLPLLDALETNPPDLMMLSHAHLDHLGALPLVKRRFPHLPVYATRATKRIALEVLNDAVKVAEMQGAPLYEPGEASAAVANLRGIEPFQPLAFASGKITPYPAGHILGAVGLLIETREGTLFHTGDFSNVAALTADKVYFPPQPVPVDAVISEATYGDTNLPGRKEQVRNLVEALRTVIEGGGRVLIPTFALGRAQELILLVLNHQASGLLPQVPLYLDGLVRSLTQVYASLLSELPEKVRNLAKASSLSPFFRGDVQLVKDSSQRERIVRSQAPAIILASSGMLSGGVSPIYARSIVQEENSALFVVGYQDAESPGRRLLELERGGEVFLPGSQRGSFEPVPVSCQVARYYLSAHADRVGILGLLAQYPSPRAILVHAESNARHSLMEGLRKDREVNLPKNGEWVNLAGPVRFGKAALSSHMQAIGRAESSKPQPQPGRMRRFKSNVKASISGKRVLLEFSDDIDVNHLFPTGEYKITVLKGRITRVELRQVEPSDAGEDEGQAEPS